jgi:hypothetical protein
MADKNDRYAQTLITLANDYSVAEDKANDDENLSQEAIAHGAVEALTKALAAYLGVDDGEAAIIILMASE